MQKFEIMTVKVVLKNADYTNTQIAGSIFATNMGASLFIGLCGSAAASGFAPVMFEWHVSSIPSFTKLRGQTGPLYPSPSEIHLLDVLC